MAYYKGFNREQVNTQQAQATKGPNMNEALGNVDAKLKNASHAIDALNNLANGVVVAADKRIQTEATQRGLMEAQKDTGTDKVASEVNPLAWGASAQKDAYNRVRAQSMLVDMPSQIEKNVYDLSMFKHNKPVDELNYEQQAGLYQQAQDSYLKEKGIDKNPELFTVANQMAMDIQTKHLPKMHESAVELGKKKARGYVGNSAVMISKAVRDPKGILEAFDAQDVDYASAMGLDLKKPEQKQQYDATVDSMNKLGNRDQLDQAKLEGMLNAISNNPDQNLDLVSVLNSKEFNERFGYMPEYKKVVEQVDKIAASAKERKRNENSKAEENLVYKAMLSHSFTSEKDVDDTLSTMSFLDDKKKFELRQKAVKYVENSNQAFKLKDAYDRGDVGHIKAATKDAQSALFSQLIMPVSEISLDNSRISVDQAYGIKTFVDKTGIVPKEIYDSANAISFDPKVIQNQVENFRTMSGHLGLQNMKAMYDTQQQARLTVVSNLMNQYPKDTWKDHLDVLKKFDEDVDNKSNAAIMSKVDKQLKDIGMENVISKFGAEGGSNVLFGSNDMQPLFTFRDTNMASQEYASNDVKLRAYTHALAGKPMEMAVSDAMEDFKMQNEWVDIGNTSAFIPKEFGADSKTLEKYLNEATTVPKGYNTNTRKVEEGSSYNIINKIMENSGLDPKDHDMRNMFIKNKISIAPTYDYYRTKLLEISVDGIPQGEYININGYNNFKKTNATREQVINRQESEVKIDRKKQGLNPEVDPRAAEIQRVLLKISNKVKTLWSPTTIIIEG